VPINCTIGQTKGFSNAFRKTIFGLQRPPCCGRATDLHTVLRHRPRPRARQSDHLQSLRGNRKNDSQDGSRLLIGRSGAGAGSTDFGASHSRAAPVKVLRAARRSRPLRNAEPSFCSSPDDSYFCASA
jgi:hypothetical protein